MKKHKLKIIILSIAIGVNTLFGGYSYLGEKASEIATFVDSLKINNPLQIIKGGQPLDPSHFGNF